MSVLWNFTGANGDGEGPYGGLLYDAGVFYGTTGYGGAVGGGIVYALSNLPLPPIGFSISVAGTSNLVQFATTSGIQYDVLRSTDLSSWTTVSTVTSPISGQLNFHASNPPQPAAYYRLRQH